MFTKNILTFSNNLEDLRDFIEMVSEFLSKRDNEELKSDPMAFSPVVLAHVKAWKEEFKDVDDQTIEKIEKFLSEKGVEFTETEENGVSVKITPDDSNKDMVEALGKFKKAEKRKRNLYANSLINLISQVELFVSQLAHQYYIKYPDKINTKDKQLSLDDLVKFDSVEDARIYLIDKKIESVLWGNIQDWIKFLRNDLNLSMKYIDPYVDRLSEAALRRNLFVHNSGVVNRIYWNNYPRSLGTPPEIDKEVRINSGYLHDVIMMIEKCFVLIASELWKNTDPDNDERSVLLISMAFENMIKGNYDLSESYSFFTMNDKSSKEIRRLYGTINYWLSIKMQNRFNEVRSEVEKADFSGKSRLISCAQNVLLDREDKAKEDIINLLEHDDEFGIEQLKEWPLFKTLRDSGELDDIIRDFDHDETLEN